MDLDSPIFPIGIVLLTESRRQTKTPRTSAYIPPSFSERSLPAGATGALLQLLAPDPRTSPHIDSTIETIKPNSSTIDISKNN
jgi:hypothetical protein